VTATRPDDRLLRLSEVRTRTALARTTIYRKMREGSFPEPLKVGVRAVRWLESEIDSWLSSRPRASGYTPD
jgi:prophage regulatory protein